MAKKSITNLLSHMDFKDSIRQLSERALKMKDQLATEEATKTAVLLPFLQVLGYDVFNPSEVSPEFVADVGIKKGEKIDYAVIGCVNNSV